MKDICRGTILHRFFTTTIPPKHKFFVVIGEDDSHYVGYFFVNSRVNQYVYRHQPMLDMQIMIKRSDYAFLAYDSYIGAHELNTISKSVLLSELTDGQTEIKGSLTAKDMDCLLKNARESDIFSQYEKDTYFN